MAAADFVAYERITGSPTARIALTCEHASEFLPPPYAFGADDARLIGTHWAYDLGARELVFALAEELSCEAVLATFSRLLVDPNRSEHNAELFRQHAEGLPVRLNAQIDAADRERRLATYYRPYHEAIERSLDRVRPALLFSVHSFTPLYEGVPRSVEIGVLFNREERLARVLAAELRAHGYASHENEPWSGKGGLMYSVESHADRVGAHALEIEVRQDLACEAGYRAALVPAIAHACARCWRPSDQRSSSRPINSAKLQGR